MTDPVAVEKTVHLYAKDDSDHPLRREVVVWCPGCDQSHDFTVEVLDPEYRRPNGTPEPVWQWDGNLEKPTFSPSMLAYSTVHLCEGQHEPVVCEDPENCGEKGHLIMNAERGGEIPAKEDRVLGHNTPHTMEPAWGNCHSFLNAGVWEFLSDCAHSMAGQNVPMVPLPDWRR